MGSMYTTDYDIDLLNDLSTRNRVKQLPFKYSHATNRSMSLFLIDISYFLWIIISLVVEAYNELF